MARPRVHGRSEAELSPILVASVKPRLHPAGRVGHADQRAVCQATLAFRYGPLNGGAAPSGPST